MTIFTDAREKALEQDSTREAMVRVCGLEIITLIHHVRLADTPEQKRDNSQELFYEACSKYGPKFLMEAGITPVIADALRDWDDSEAKQYCAFAIQRIVQDKDLALKLTETDILESLVSFCEYKNEHGFRPAFGPLAILVDIPEVAQRMRDVPDVIETLEKLESGSSEITRMLGKLRSLEPTGRMLKPARASKEDDADECV